MKQANLNAVIVIGGAKTGSIGEEIVKSIQYLAGFGDVKVVQLDSQHAEEYIGTEFLKVDLSGDAALNPASPHSVRNAVWDAMEYIHRSRRKLIGVVYAAGVNHLGSVLDYTPDLWHDTVDVNARGVWLTAQAVSQWFLDYSNEPILERAFNRANIVPTIVLGSNTAYVAKTRSFAYSFSKAGLMHMLKSMHREMAPQGWHFTSLDFGIVMDSGMTDKTIVELREQRGWTAEQAREMLLRNIPTGYGVSKAEVAAWTKFLLENPGFSAGGNSIRIDSGQQQG